MTRSTAAIIILSVYAAIITAVLLWPTSVEYVEVDPEQFRIEERLRLREIDIADLECRLDSMVEVMNARPAIRKKKRDALAVQRVSQNDSIHAALLHERLK